VSREEPASWQVARSVSPNFPYLISAQEIFCVLDVMFFIRNDSVIGNNCRRFSERHLVACRKPKSGRETLQGARAEPFS
jgi:hypothetical protein